MEIILAFVHQWNTVDIHSHRWTVHTGTDATDVHGRRVAAAIVGHHKRRNIGTQLAEVANTQTLYVSIRKHRAAQRLLAKTEYFLGL